MRVSNQKINPSLEKQILSELIKTLADLKSAKEIQTFLVDFFNESELETFAKRLAVAYWLKKGRSYNNIKDNLKVSSATVATVQATLETPGIKLALKKLEADEWANQWTEKIKKIIK